MMGSRAGIAERRLRPLWDAIDTRQYKTALKLTSGLQVKHPDSSYILALKALVLERTGKSDEALLLCQQARDSGPVDELTLNTLQTVYNRLHLRNLPTFPPCLLAVSFISIKVCLHTNELSLVLALQQKFPLLLVRWYCGAHFYQINQFSSPHSSKAE
jgi:hypothetical protein